MGIKLPEIEQQEEVDFEVFKSNMPILDAFFALNDRAWQYTDMGELIGIDYKAAEVIWEKLGIQLSPNKFSLFMVFEQAVVSELRKRKK